MIPAAANPIHPFIHPSLHLSIYQSIHHYQTTLRQRRKLLLFAVSADLVIDRQRSLISDRQRGRAVGRGWKIAGAAARSRWKFNAARGHFWAAAGKMQRLIKPPLKCVADPGTAVKLRDYTGEKKADSLIIRSLNNLSQLTWAWRVELIINQEI